MATKYSSEAISAFLEEWQRLRQEGVTQKQFTRERGLSERTFRNWESRFEPKAETPNELIAKAEVLVEELKRLIDALQPPAPLPNDQPTRPQSPGWGSSHPDHRWFF